MPPNETSALLKNYRTQPYQHTNGNNHTKTDTGYHAVDDNNHIVYVNKDLTEYEPIFCLNEYPSALTLDELLPYKFDPWWQNIRRILLFAFWLFLLLTFSSACLLSYLRAGQTSCSILEKQISNNSAGMLPSSSNIILTATTAFPTIIADVLPTDLLGGK